MAGGQGGNTQDGTGMDGVWLAVIFLVLFYLLITYKSEWFLGPWKLLKLGEMWFLGLMPIDMGARVEFGRIVEWLSNTPADQLNYAQADFINKKVAPYFQWLAAPLLALLGLYIMMFRAVPAKKHTMETLLAQEAEIWPQVSLMVKNHPDLDDPRNGPWGAAQSPAEFAVKQGFWKPKEKLFDRQLALSLIHI